MNQLDDIRDFLLFVGGGIAVGLGKILENRLFVCFDVIIGQGRTWSNDYRGML
jgi:hypothetical protein